MSCSSIEYTRYHVSYYDADSTLCSHLYLCPHSGITDLTCMVSVNNITIMSVSWASSFISNVIIGLNCAVYSVGFVRTVDL